MILVLLTALTVASAPSPPAAPPAFTEEDLRAHPTLATWLAVWTREPSPQTDEFRISDSAQFDAHPWPLPDPEWNLSTLTGWERVRWASSPDSEFAASVLPAADSFGRLMTGPDSQAELIRVSTRSRFIVSQCGTTCVYYGAWWLDARDLLIAMADWENVRPVIIRIDPKTLTSWTFLGPAQVPRLDGPLKSDLRAWMETTYPTLRW